MTAKTSTRGDLPPIPWHPDPIPAGEAVESADEPAWQAWDEAKAQWDRYEQRKAAIDPAASPDEYEARCKRIARELGL